MNGDDNMINDKAGFYRTLQEKLSPRSGTIQSLVQKDGIYWETVLDIRWKGDIHFVAERSLFREGLTAYYVMRDGQRISHLFMSGRPDEQLIRSMQNMIDEIENGKFRNKKTMSEKIKSIVEERQLVSYMNKTKWNELLSALSERLPRNCVRYKTVFEETAPEGYHNVQGDEVLCHMDIAQIEWMRIKSYFKELKHTGALISDKVTVHDKKAVLLQIFNEYSIPYEYDEAEQEFVVYGYKHCSTN